MKDTGTSLDMLNDYAELRLVTAVISDLKQRILALAQTGERKDELLQSLGVAEASALLLMYEIGIENSPSATLAMRKYLAQTG